MTPAEFKALPPLIRRADALAIGISNDVLTALRFDVKNAGDPVPARRIGFVRGLRGRPKVKVNGKVKKRQGPGYALIIKSTVAALLPREYR